MVYEDDGYDDGGGLGKELNKFFIVGVFVVGIGVGVVFDTAVDLELLNVVSREILDRWMLSLELCMVNGVLVMVFD